MAFFTNPPHFFIKTGRQIPQVQAAIFGQMPFLSQIGIRYQRFMIIGGGGPVANRATAAPVSAIYGCLPFMPADTYPPHLFTRTGCNISGC